MTDAPARPQTASTPGGFGPGNFGVVEWFRPGEHERVEAVLAGLRRLGVTRLRTNLSWADWHRPDGPAWYDWLLPRLAREVEVLPCVTYTPPSLAVAPKPSAPPRRLRDYADFVDLLIDRHGRHFDWLQLWNEPNNLNDWDWQMDAGWQGFAEMVGAAAHWARRRGKRTVLAGMCPTDPAWLAAMGRRGVLAHIDAVALHAFPGTWESEWSGWPAVTAGVRAALDAQGHAPELWITEVGYSTWRHDQMAQMRVFLDALEAPVERVYWYGYQDLHPALPSQEGFHFDERHYHLGLVTAEGAPKLLHRLLAEGGVGRVRSLARAAAAARPAPEGGGYTLITGGAGFVGANIADALAADGERVVLFDNLSRPGVEDNLRWLDHRHGPRVRAEVADIRDRFAVQAAVAGARRVIHLAAQVAVTTSVADPRHDFDVNLAGTLNLLEALRARPAPPPLVFASTNKVYGALAHLPLTAEATRYAAADPRLGAQGVSEDQPIELHSPYGCSKGGADQYVLDYARIYGLPACVFRMSCLYGPRQFGTEDQGWVAHFLISALAGRAITIFGDGRQVRDILHIDDAVAAYRLALDNMAELRGRVFNIGGGPANAVSLLEVLEVIAGLTGRRPEVRFRDWRPGDQLYYVSDTGRFAAATGWRARVAAPEGIGRLHDWLTASGEVPPLTEASA